MELIRHWQYVSWSGIYQIQKKKPFAGLYKTTEKKKKEMKKQAIANFFALHTNAKKDILLRLLITISQL